MGMNYRHFGNTFSKNTDLLIKGCMYLNCMDFDEELRELDPILMDKYMAEGYDRYLNSDNGIDPFILGDAMWWAFNDYFHSEEDDEDRPNIFDVEKTLTDYIQIRLGVIG